MQCCLDFFFQVVMFMHLDVTCPILYRKGLMNTNVANANSFSETFMIYTVVFKNSKERRKR